MAEIKKITKAPPFLGGLAAKINEIIDALRPLLNITSNDQTVTITAADNNIDLSSPPGGGGGGGLPPGYTFEEFTICDSGTPATRWWPTWPTNPEA